jgi:hypothetical protein
MRIIPILHIENQNMHIRGTVLVGSIFTELRTAGNGTSTRLADEVELLTY